MAEADRHYDAADFPVAGKLHTAARDGHRARIWWPRSARWRPDLVSDVLLRCPIPSCTVSGRRGAPRELLASSSSVPSRATALCGSRTVRHLQEDRGMDRAALRDMLRRYSAPERHEPGTLAAVLSAPGAARHGGADSAASGPRRRSSWAQWRLARLADAGVGAPAGAAGGSSDSPVSLAYPWRAAVALAVR